MLKNQAKSGGQSAARPAEGEKRIPATERVLDHILVEMDAGRLVPGGRVNAARIASALKLSAAPVREALSVLAGRGVIDLLPEKGAVMRPMAYDEVCDRWLVLEAISSVGLALAASAIASGADTSKVLDKYAAIAMADDDEDLQPVDFLIRLNEWHFAVNELGANSFVNLALERLGMPYWDRYLADSIDVLGHIDAYRTNYRRIHEAVMAGDGGSAVAAMRFHAQWSVRKIREAEARAPKKRRKRRSKLEIEATP